MVRLGDGLRTRKGRELRTEVSCRKARGRMLRYAESMAVMGRAKR
jgi:hypothetical protein